MAGQGRPLKAMVDALQEVADAVNSPNPRVEVRQVVRVCRLGTPFVSYFGIAFHFAELEIRTKADNLEEACQKVDTLQALIQKDVEEGCEKVNSSHSRNLVRVKRAADLLKVFFEQVLASRENSLVSPLNKAYNQVFAPYHGSTVRQAVSASMDDLLTKALLFRLLSETEDSGNDLMHKYIAAATPVVQYIDRLFLSNGSAKELLRMI